MNLKGLSIEERGYLAVLARIAETRTQPPCVRLQLAPDAMGTTITEKFAPAAPGEMRQRTMLQEIAWKFDRGRIGKSLRSQIITLEHLMRGEAVHIYAPTMKAAEDQALATLDLFEQCFEVVGVDRTRTVNVTPPPYPEFIELDSAMLAEVSQTVSRNTHGKDGKQ